MVLLLYIVHAANVCMHARCPTTPYLISTPLIIQRAAEKIRLDYNGVANGAAKVKDYLRATLVVTTMPEVCKVWSAVEELKAQGRLKVVSIKNRLR